MWVRRNDGARLAVEEQGEGERCFVFLHPLAGRRQFWAEQTDYLVRREEHVVSLDLRGMGESEAASDYRIEAHADDLNCVVEALNLHRLVLVGHSYGALVLLAYAGAHPEKIDGLVFVDPSGDPRRIPEVVLAEIREGLRPERYVAFMDAWFSALLTSSRPETRATVLDALHHTARDPIEGCLSDKLAFNPEPALQRYRGPRVSIVSERSLGPSSLHEQLPGIPHVVMSGVSHWVYLDAPEVFDKHLDTFVRGL